MKNNTYDVPAYKFGIVKVNDYGCKSEHSANFYFNAIKHDNATIIPFENVDGLTVEEVKKFLGVEEVLFISYLNFKKTFVDDSRQQNYINFTMLIDKETLQSNQSMPIDELVEKQIENRYHNESYDNYQRIFNCFFERYQDKSYTKTRKRIQRLENSKK